MAETLCNTKCMASIDWMRVRSSSGPVNLRAQDDDTVVMTGGSFSTSDDAKTVTLQPQTSVVSNASSHRSQERTWAATREPFDDTLSERDWKAGLCSCEDSTTSKFSLNCCWCYHKYMIAMRLGETPFMGLIPCAAFGMRVKVRTLFGIKGSIIKDFLTTLFCEPCTVCQMTRELDSVGL